MSAKLLVLIVQVSLTCCAPIMQLMPLQFGMQPQLQLQYGMQPQMPLLRKMLPGNLNSPVVMFPQRPMMILVPLPQSNADDRYTNLNEYKNDNRKEDSQINTGFVDEYSEAVIVEAQPSTKNVLTSNALPKNAVVLMPQGRLGIGDIISYIPFLPIEINVPDTISWIINGIGGWFRPQAEVPMDSNVKRISSKGPMMPILMMPLGGPTLPQMANHLFIQ